MCIRDRDYSAVFIDAFERLTSEDMEETEVYIQNVYATLFSFQHDPRVNLNMLRTALINTRKLNKALQDMLHNMDRFFARLLDQKTYGELLKEHLEGYVEEIVQKKYHILKTSDNFYIYKMDIKKVLRDMREDEEWIEKIRERSRAQGDTKEDVCLLYTSKAGATRWKSAFQAPTHVTKKRQLKRGCRRRTLRKLIMKYILMR